MDVRRGSLEEKNIRKCLNPSLLNPASWISVLAINGGVSHGLISTGPALPHGWAGLLLNDACGVIYFTEKRD